MEPITFILFLLGFVLLITGADLLVRGAAQLAEKMGISRLIVGLTVVALGTSAPELAINLQSAWTGQPDLAVGNVVGSNILNILLILGIGALITPLSVHKRLIKLEIPLMIGASFLLLWLSFDGILNRWEGLLLFSGIVFYTLYSIKTCTQEKDIEAQSPSEDATQGKFNFLIQLGLIVIGLGLLVQGSQWLVDGAIVLAKLFGISELIIGLTIISMGTSLPEIATVVVATLRGEQELVIGNVIGSNLFNILLVLGFTSLVAPNGLEVPHAAIVFDIPVMIVVAIACLPIFFTDYLIERWEGSLFLGYYVAYTLYLFLNATQHSLLPAYSAAMLLFVIPLTVITMLVFVWQSSRNNG
jgi:cation:H+ antiporter